MSLKSRRSITGRDGYRSLSRSPHFGFETRLDGINNAHAIFLECIIYFECIVHARPASFQIQNGGSVRRNYSMAIVAFFYHEVVAVSFKIRFPCGTSLESDHFEEMLEEEVLVRMMHFLVVFFLFYNKRSVRNESSF